MKTKKRLFNNIASFLSSIWATILVDVILVVIFLCLGIRFNPQKSFLELLGDIFTNGVTVSVIIVEIILLINNIIKKASAIRLEESRKIFDDHYAIIRRYSYYDVYKSDDNNCFPTNGALMSLKKFADCSGDNRKLLKQHRAAVVNSNKKLYKAFSKELEKWDRRFIKIPEVLVFANIDGKARLKFDDTNTEYKLPEFVENNSTHIMEAHNTSLYRNNETIRLCDVKYDNGTNELTLVTSRTCYYDMLLTNRCMDYNLGSGITIRNKYEYRNYVLPLNETQLSNQIGIEGLILSNDGWALIEKRRKNERTIWRDKFGQPISFSMRKNELLDKYEETLRPEAETHIKKMIDKGLYKFGLNMGENESQYTFSLSDNFLGISRDLTEGGKPNMYFYIIVNCDHIKLKEVLENAAKEANNRSDSANKKPVELKNLKRSYYLCDINNISVNYNYIMKLNNKIAVAVNRAKKDCLFNKLKFGFKERFVMHNMEKECGESFIGCLAFYEICCKRIEKQLNLSNGTNANE